MLTPEVAWLMGQIEKQGGFTILLVKAPISPKLQFWHLQEPQGCGRSDEESGLTQKEATAQMPWPMERAASQGSSISREQNPRETESQGSCSYAPCEVSLHPSTDVTLLPAESLCKGKYMSCLLTVRILSNKDHPIIKSQENESSHP